MIRPEDTSSNTVTSRNGKEDLANSIELELGRVDGSNQRSLNYDRDGSPEVTVTVMSSKKYLRKKVPSKTRKINKSGTSSSIVLSKTSESLDSGADIAGINKSIKDLLNRDNQPEKAASPGPK